jgi:hypothetical protein
VNDPHLEDHATGVELQMTELAEQMERARVQHRSDDVVRLQRQMDALQEELVSTSEQLADAHWERPSIQG